MRSAPLYHLQRFIIYNIFSGHIDVDGSFAWSVWKATKCTNITICSFWQIRCFLRSTGRCWIVERFHWSPCISLRVTRDSEWQWPPMAHIEIVNCWVYVFYWLIWQLENGKPSKLNNDEEIAEIRPRQEAKEKKETIHTNRKKNDKIFNNVEHSTDAAVTI